MSNLPTDPYKGVRDFYPEDMRLQQHIYDTWSHVAESFGYVRYDASVLEPAELYRAKSGEEIINEQTYTFTDRGNREVTLRPEMTPTVARMIAAKRRELALPVRWYSMPNLFRYERPQKGRLREHWQLNCDIFGSDAVEADVEIILLAHSIMRAFGAKDNMFEINVSNLSILAPALEKISVAAGRAHDVRKLLDQRPKIEDYDQKFSELTDADPKEFDDALEAELENAGVQSVLDTLRELGVTNVVTNTSVVRGMDYYTGTVFEVFDTSKENNRSLFGGGRYDNLTELFGSEKVSGVGFGMGDVTIRDFMETHNLIPELTLGSTVMLLTTESSFIGDAQKIAETLREKNITTSVNLTDKKLGDQIKLAEKQGAEYIVVIGQDELKNDTFTLKKLSDGTETSGSLNELIEKLR